jgi:hypothetical protein
MEPLVNLTKTQLVALYPVLGLTLKQSKDSIIMAIEIHRLYLTLFSDTDTVIPVQCNNSMVLAQ